MRFSRSGKASQSPPASLRECEPGRATMLLRTRKSPTVCGPIGLRASPGLSRLEVGMDRFNTIKKLLEEYEKEMNLISLKDKYNAKNTEKIVIKRVKG